ncbi:DUF4097 domain-containing protein [Acholeplasma sp. OttesenSCG-928-E16]|nr:DUF4097 domain-containing protein [Acholeplasma sp. OttesenSCG-928-E16]
MRKFMVFLSILFVIGLSLFAASCFMGTTFSEYRDMILDEENYEEKIIVHQYNEDEIKLDFNLSSKNVVFQYEETSEITIKYYENIEKDEVVNTYQDGTLAFSIKRKWYFNIYFLPFLTEKYDLMTVTLPKDIVFENFKIKVSSGNITIPSLKVNDKIDLLTSSGKINVNDINTNGFYTEVNSGNVVINNLITSDIQARISSGNLSVNNVTCNNMTINMNSGNAHIKYATVKNADVRIQSGNLVFDNSKVDNFSNLKISSGIVTLNKVELTNINATVSSGSLKLNIKDAKDFEYDLKASSGSIKINGQGQGSRYQKNGTEGLIYIRITSGWIEINY